MGWSIQNVLISLYGDCCYCWLMLVLIFLGFYFIFVACKANFVMKIRQSRTVQVRIVEIVRVNKKWVG